MKNVLQRAYALEIQKILNREGFTSNRGFYKRVREETGVYESGNHNALSIKDALIEQGLVKMPEQPMEALVMSSILDKFNVKEITPEIVKQLHKAGFKKRTDKQTKEAYYIRPWTGKIFSRYEIADVPAGLKEKATAAKQQRKKTLTAAQVRKRFGVKRIMPKHVAELEEEGFHKTKSEKAPHDVIFVREAVAC